MKRITNSYDSFEDRKKAQVLSVVFIIAFFTVIPIIFILNLLQGDILEVYLISIYTLILTICFYFDINGKIDVALILIGFTTVLSSFIISYFANEQTGAPFANLVLAIIGPQVLKSKRLKHSFLALSFVSFAITFFYELSTKTFDSREYPTILFTLLLVFVGLYYADNQSTRYQKQLEEANKKLEASNLEIQKQHGELAALQKEKHRKELEDKQKDIDNVVANNRMQLKIRENILAKIGKIRNEDEALKVLKNLNLELRSQIETQKKLEFSQTKLETINNQFYSRLLESHPKLSKKETELCSYIRLGLSTKEIAILINTSENTIYVTKNRLKIKLNLGTSTEIFSYLVSV